MNDAERENLEKQILLRSTGELAPEENAALDAALARDSEAADFARFVTEHLPGRAPRDFAATAMREAAAVRHAAPARKVIAFPPRWKFAAAAAVVAVASLVAVRIFTPEPPAARLVTTPAPARVMADISTRVDALESQLTAARQRLAHGRYHRTKDLL